MHVRQSSQNEIEYELYEKTELEKALSSKLFSEISRPSNDTFRYMRIPKYSTSHSSMKHSIQKRVYMIIFSCMDLIIHENG
jgi:hypothetical protein